MSGQSIAESWVAGFAGLETPLDRVFLRRLNWQMEEAAAFTRAERSRRHANWFCSLSWYRQWWALVTGR